MKCFFPILAVISALVLPNCHKTKTSLPPFRFQFGIVKEGGIRQVAGNRIPFRPGSEYGWQLDLENPRGTVLVREVFTLPAPTAWKFENAEKKADQTGGAKTERVQIEQNGTVFSKEMKITAYKHVKHLSSYKILASDPLGAYRLELFLDGKPAIIFEFTLVKDEALAASTAPAEEVKAGA